jgi:hypothetical protein
MSCASSGGSPGSRDEAATTTDGSRKTQQEVQSELMTFADRYFAATLESAKILESVAKTPESRYTAAAARVAALVTVTDIAASPNPGGALLDMTVFVTLRRMVWENYWMPEVYGDGGLPVRDILLELEEDIWGIAAGVYSPDQLTELRELIHDWRSSHPNVRAVDFVRLTKLGDARRVQRLIDAGRPGGMLAPVREANRELEEMRLLAERLTFLATRLQLLATLQVEMVCRGVGSLRRGLCDPGRGPPRGAPSRRRPDPEGSACGAEADLRGAHGRGRGAAPDSRRLPGNLRFGPTTH